jgi:hypothetical protein
VARTILLKPILQDFEVAKRKMVRAFPNMATLLTLRSRCN